MSLMLQVIRAAKWSSSYAVLKTGLNGMESEPVNLSINQEVLVLN